MAVSPRNRYQYRTQTVLQPGGHPTTWESYVRGQEGWNSDDHLQVLTYKGGTFRSPSYFTVTVGSNTWKYPRNASSHRINSWLYWGPPSEATSALNSAYAEFKELAVGENSSLGAAFAEWRESLGMIANRSIQLAGAARSLRKGDFNGFLRKLGVKPKRKHRRKPPKYKLADECQDCGWSTGSGGRPSMGTSSRPVTLSGNRYRLGLPLGRDFPRSVSRLTMVMVITKNGTSP